jgi:hypothetical protein
MVDILIGVCAAFAGFWFAWLLRGSRAQAEIAAVAARLESLEQQHAQRLEELSALKSVCANAIGQHREESERRAVAEERAARVPDLTARLEQRDELLLQREARIATLETQLTEERKTLEEQRRLLEQARSKWPAWSITATSSNRRTARPKMVACATGRAPVNGIAARSRRGLYARRVTRRFSRLGRRNSRAEDIWTG